MRCMRRPNNRVGFARAARPTHKSDAPTLGCMIRALLLTIVPSSLLMILASCGKDEHSGVDAGLLSTDIHVSVAQQALVFPLVALDDYAYRKQSFSLNRKGDSERAVSALKQFLRDSADPRKPLVLDGLSVVVRTYGWNDADMRQRRVCSLLTREWARSVCDNPWAATQQALPVNRFRLVDLRSLQIEDSNSPTNCPDDGKPRRPLPEKTREAVMVCTAMVYGGDDDEFHSAVSRIDGHLGAVWTVWRHGQNGETAEAMTERGESHRRLCAICAWTE
jgi:hypothetical protein